MHPRTLAVAGIVLGLFATATAATPTSRADGNAVEAAIPYVDCPVLGPGGSVYTCCPEDTEVDILNVHIRITWKCLRFSWTGVGLE